MARNWNPSLAQLVAARDALERCSWFVGVAIENVSADGKLIFNEQEFEHNLNRFEEQMGVVLDACSSDVACTAVAMACILDEMEMHNEGEIEEAGIEDREPEGLLSMANEEDRKAMAQQALENWDHDTTKDIGETVMYSLQAIVEGK